MTCTTCATCGNGRDVAVDIRPCRWPDRPGGVPLCLLCRRRIRAAIAAFVDNLRRRPDITRRAYRPRRQEAA